MSINKKYQADNKKCKVTFKLTKKQANGAEQVNLVGEFNDWDMHGSPMKKSTNGDFTVALNLKTGAEYQFKYLIDYHEWVNDPKADNYVPNEFQGENSVVAV